MALRPADKELSYGYHRAEILGTILSIVFLWGLTIWLLYAATLRLLNPPEIEEGFMLLTALAGLLFNIIQLAILGHGHAHGHGGHDHGHDHGHGHDHHHHGHTHGSSNQMTQPLLEDHNHSHGHHHHEHSDQKASKHKNINVTAAELHVLGDLLNSVGVIIAAVIIFFFKSATIADPICTYVFSVIVFYQSVPVIKDCLHVLMEGSPDDYNTEEVYKAFMDIPGVEEVHDMHIWSISSGKHSLSAHIKSDNPLETLKLVTQLCQDRFKITHTTIQVEGHDDNAHKFECSNDIHN